MKTVPTGRAVKDFIASIENVERREDAAAMLEFMNDVTGVAARMWGTSIIGYGEYDYKRADGSEHKFMVAGFSPRKANMVVYIMSGVAQYAERLKAMGKFKHSVSCLYLPRLKSLDLNVLESVVKDDIEEMKKRYTVRI